MTDEAPRVTVVIVTFRSRGDLPACLAALGPAGEGLGYEVTVVDNASGDGTVEWLRAQHPGVHVIANAANRGFAAAVNQAAREARGAHLLLLNPDAVPAAGSLGVLVAALDGAPDVGLAGPQLVDPDGSRQRSAWDAPRLEALAFEAFLLDNLFPHSRLNPRAAPAYPSAADVDALSGACLLVRRACFESLGGLDEAFFLYFEDIDLGLRARAAGWRCRLVPEARALHRVGGSAFQDRRAFWLCYQESRRLFLRKHVAGARGAAALALQWIGVALRAVVYAVAGLAGRPDLRREAGHHAAVLRRFWSGAAA